MRYLIGFLACLLLAGSAFAQDPGIPDTIIVDTVYVDLGQPYADLPVFAVTDDSVAFYNMPLTWISDYEGIDPSEIYYEHPVEHWDVHDSVIFNQRFIRMIGWDEHDFFFIRTNGLRWHCWTLRFTIDSLSPPQIVTVDTTYDNVNGGILLGLRGGQIGFTPEFIPGCIYYGITSDVNDDKQSLPYDIIYLKNYPNPFNASTTIEFKLPEEAEVELSIYNILGQKIVTLFDRRSPAGDYSLIWNAVDFPSGIYFARLEANLYSQNIKMLMLK